MNFTKSIIHWYQDHKRELPWRDAKDAYTIWISEIILQQTRVNQGYDYFLRFMRRFPDLQSLAAAHEDEVMKYWEGLGYYSRARNLHVAARSMTDGFPTTYEGVRALKGVGDYTAAAICSFAYGMPYAVIDGNVYRVLARYFGIDTPIDSTEGKKTFAAMAQEYLDKQQPACYNQAIMDFGATQCVPRSPDCTLCPLAETCYAFRNNSIDCLPVKEHKTKITHRYFTYIYIAQPDGYTYIRKRTAHDIWQNLFELPLIETKQKTESADELMQLPACRTLFSAQPLSLIAIAQDVRHVLTHRIIHADFYIAVTGEDFMTPSGFQRISAEQLKDYAFPRLLHSFIETADNFCKKSGLYGKKNTFKVEIK